MNNRLVSIIIPTYKGSENIRRAIESVLAQNYHMIEIIVVDDNGIGTQAQIETKEIMKEYENDERVQYICHSKNINGSAARNTGIKIAKGDYIALLDDDDLFYPHKIRLQYEVLSASDEDVGLCYTAFDVIFPDKRERFQQATVAGDICYEVLCNKVSMPSSVMMFKKSAWEQINGFDESFIRHQDWEFLVRLSKYNKVIAINKACVRRIILKRNSPKNAEIYKNLREFYLQKMKPIIMTFNKRQQKNIYFVHYFSIAKEFLKEKNFKQAIKYSLKSGSFISVLYKLFGDGVLYVSSKFNKRNANDSI